MPLTEEVVLSESKESIRNLKRTDPAEMKQSSYSGSFTYFDRLIFQVRTEQKQTTSTVTTLITAHTGVFIYQPKNNDWIIGLEKA